MVGTEQPVNASARRLGVHLDASLGGDLTERRSFLEVSEDPFGEIVPARESAALAHLDDGLSVLIQLVLQRDVLLLKS